LQATNQAVSAVKQQTENIAIQAGGIKDDVRILHKDISSLCRNGFEELEKISKNTQNNAQSIETAVATTLNEYGAEMRNALSQQTGQIMGLMTKHKGQIEVVVSSAEHIAIPHSCFAG
jgi:alpha-galactosidase/6-phospho-beta-glucosidase family protein